jgi:hypothetical protein
VEFPEVELPTEVVVLPDEVWLALEEELTFWVELAMVLFEPPTMVVLVAMMVALELLPVVPLRGAVELSITMVELLTEGVVTLPELTGRLVPLLVLLLPTIGPVLLLVLFEGTPTVPFPLVELPPVGMVELDPVEELPELVLGVDEGTVKVLESTTLHS